MDLSLSNMFISLLMLPSISFLTGLKAMPNMSTNLTMHFEASRNCSVSIKPSETMSTNGTTVSKKTGFLSLISMCE
ncbi:hypothetical protein DERP_002171 [Dermatophagoides pteronyssinus]|uniref:Uncharacterized protein n=1 Tax=Dermatophagoides pteronyssinus TaxID=6956 RepID=A0ABQ8JGZ7_DERPT|nr:hypothetical protein DERP_002171 [Dermatophagoides pteronyssinus]